MLCWFDLSAEQSSLLADIGIVLSNRSLFFTSICLYSLIVVSLFCFAFRNDFLARTTFRRSKVHSQGTASDLLCNSVRAVLEWPIRWADGSTLNEWTCHYLLTECVSNDWALVSSLSSLALMVMSWSILMLFIISNLTQIGTSLYYSVDWQCFEDIWVNRNNCLFSLCSVLFLLFIWHGPRDHRSMATFFSHSCQFSFICALHCFRLLLRSVWCAREQSERFRGMSTILFNWKNIFVYSKSDYILKSAISSGISITTASHPYLAEISAHAIDPASTLWLGWIVRF